MRGGKLPLVRGKFVERAFQLAINSGKTLIDFFMVLIIS